MTVAAALLPLAVLVFWIGLYPRYFLDRMAPALSTATAAAAQVIRDEAAPAVAETQVNIREVPRRAD